MSDFKRLMLHTRSQKVLYAEDDINIRNSISELLEQFFADVTAVSDGAEALEAFEKGKYDIVFTDIAMPHTNGLTLIETILQSDPEQTIVVTTAHDEEEYRRFFRERGVYELPKPISLDALLTLLQSLFEHENAAV